MIHFKDIHQAIMFLALQIKYDLAYILLNALSFRHGEIIVVKEEKNC